MFIPQKFEELENCIPSFLNSVRIPPVFVSVCIFVFDTFIHSCITFGHFYHVADLTIVQRLIDIE